jgi:hypothetical protein
MTKLSNTSPTVTAESSVGTTPTHMIGDTCCKYPLQEKRAFDSETRVLSCAAAALRGKKSTIEEVFLEQICYTS